MPSAPNVVLFISDQQRLKAVLAEWLRASNDPWPEVAAADFHVAETPGDWAELATKGI